MQVLQLHFDPVGSPALLAQRLQEAVQAGARSVLVLAGDGVAWPAEAVNPLLQALPVPVFGGVFPQVLHGGMHTETGLVVALPPELVQPYLEAGLLQVLDFDLGLRMDAYGLITRRGHQPSPGAALMLGCLREEARRRGLSA